jgi:uncharacterized protein with HEPN domain
VKEGSDNDRFCVTRMIEAIEEAKKDMATGYDAFRVRNSSEQKTLLLDLIHLVESAQGLSASFRSANRWMASHLDRMRDLRNEQLVHHYSEMDAEDVWSFVSKDMPKLERQLRLARFPKDRGR